jgi:hypothetical protein
MLEAAQGVLIAAWFVALIMIGAAAAGGSWIGGGAGLIGLALSAIGMVISEK